jgi:hypothetical protein
MAKKFSQDYTQLTPLTGSEHVFVTRAGDDEPFWVLLSDIVAGLISGSTMNQAIDTALQNYQPKEIGKGLSTEDFTTALKDKLVGLSSGGGTMTGDQIRTALGITTLSGANTGDQVFKTINGQNVEGTGNLVVDVPAVTKAFAGGDKTIAIGNAKQITDASYTIGAGKTLTTIAWALTATIPASLTATIGSPTTIQPTLSAWSAAGQYQFTMTVTDSSGGNSSSAFWMNVLPAYGLATDVAAKAKISVTVGTSTALTFTEDNIQGSVGTPLTSNITGVTTNAVIGAVVHVIHNSGTAPTFDSKFKKLSGSGSYVVGVINHIYCEYMSSTEILYTIQQRT